MLMVAAALAMSIIAKVSRDELSAVVAFGFRTIAHVPYVQLAGVVLALNVLGTSRSSRRSKVAIIW